MGNCSCMYDSFKWCYSRPSQKNVTLLLLGLENAGKTTVAKGLAHELENGVVPTVGFSSVTLSYKKFTVVLYDLGGGPGIRAIWHKYFVDAHGIIFVLDSSDVDKITECRDVLKNLLSNEKLTGKPLLVLGNKQDTEGALDEIDLVEMLQLEDLVNQQKCPTLVETCSAITLAKSHFKDDQVIHNSFKWLLNLIERDYDELNSRVERDMMLQKEKDMADYKEKLKRVREARQSREGCSVEEGGVDNAAQDEGDEVCRKGSHMDPFRPINELLNGKAEPGDINKEDVQSADITASTSEGPVCDPSSGPGRLHRQKGFSEEIGDGPPRGRDKLNCFCNESEAGSEANLLKSQKHTTARRFSLWRNNKTVPMDIGGGGEGGEGAGQVWAIRLPSSERDGHLREDSSTFSVPQAFTVSPQPENFVELEEFTGMRCGNKGSAFQAMKG